VSEAMLPGSPDAITQTVAAQQCIARELEVDPGFDPAREIEQRVALLTDALTGTGHTAPVLGISGGIDSATAGRLCQLAVERARHGGHHAVSSRCVCPTATSMTSTTHKPR
jgi:NH3-dependent NAD+ synthetase